MKSIRARLAIVIVIVIAIVAGAAGVWYQFFRDSAPPPASLESAVSALAATATTVRGVATIAEPTTTAGAEATSGSGQGLAGVWSVVPDDRAFVGYRIGEELSRVGTTEAVGRTANVTGSLTIDDISLTAATLSVDMTTLTSDESRRDRALGGQSLETRRFPTATFTLTEPIALPVTLAAGESTSVTAKGKLTLHGVEREVEIPLDVQLSGDTLVAAGTLDIALSDFEIEKPRAPAVISVKDHGTLELQLYFQRAR